MIFDSLLIKFLIKTLLLLLIIVTHIFNLILNYIYGNENIILFNIW